MLFYFLDFSSYHHHVIATYGYYDIITYVIIQWMEEILHQLIDGLSHCNPIIYNVL